MIKYISNFSIFNTQKLYEEQPKLSFAVISAALLTIATSGVALLNYRLSNTFSFQDKLSVQKDPPKRVNTRPLVRRIKNKQVELSDLILSDLRGKVSKELFRLGFFSSFILAVIRHIEEKGQELVDQKVKNLEKSNKQLNISELKILSKLDAGELDNLYKDVDDYARAHNKTYVDDPDLVELVKGPKYFDVNEGIDSKGKTFWEIEHLPPETLDKVIISIQKGLKTFNEGS